MSLGAQGNAFQSPELTKALAERIDATLQGRPLRIMHVCGTHEHAVGNYALRSLFPPSVKLIGGPGCPVCVCPAADIEQAMQLARQGLIVATFGDMMRVPANQQSLADLRSEGADLRIVGSVADAVHLARANPDRELVFFAVGFETTACTFAAAVLADPPKNFSMLTSIRQTPPAVDALQTLDDNKLDGYLLPGHVCAVIGLKPFAHLNEQGAFLSVAGFEPVEIMHGLLLIAEQARDEAPRADNAYRRLVRYDGNTAAIRAMQQAFKLADSTWRGIGSIPGSGYVLRDELETLDARKRYDLPPSENIDASMPKGCACGEVLTGQIAPQQCPSYGRSCTPPHPLGPCMVSFEGSCRIAYTFEGFDREN